MRPTPRSDGMNPKDTDAGRRAFLRAAAGAIAAGLAGCAGPKELAGHPFALSDITINAPDRIVNLGLSFDPAALPRKKSAIGLLCVYCFKEAFDVRVIGLFDGQGAGMRDEAFGGDVHFATLTDPGSENSYLGAWWLGELDPERFDRDRLSMVLFLNGQFGYLAGKGYLHCAIVQGIVGRGPFTLLSEPVVVPYDTGWHPDRPMAELDQETGAPGSSPDDTQRDSAPGKS
jgi:hypothetical protein